MAVSPKHKDRTTEGRQRKWNGAKLELIFQNLTALECPFEVLSNESRTAINKAVFEKPIIRGLQSICFFLFSKLDEQRTARLFRFCYPSYNTKEDQQFQKISVEWLREIARSHSGITFPLISPSLFAKTTSPINLLFAFTLFVLYSCTRRLCPDDDFVLRSPIKHRGAFEIQNNSLKSATNSAVLKFSRNLQISKEYNEVENDAAEILAEYRRKVRLVDEFKVKKTILIEQLGVSSSHNHDDDNSEDDISKITKETQSNLQEVMNMWDSISAGSDGVESLREIVQSVLSRSAENKVISAAELNVQIPRQFIQDGGDIKLFKVTSLDLVTFIKVVNAMLEHLVLNLQSEFSTYFQNGSITLKARATLHSKKVDNLLDLKQKIRQLLPKIIEIVTELKEKVDARNQKEIFCQLIPGLPPPEFASSNIGTLDGNIDAILLSPLPNLEETMSWIPKVGDDRLSQFSALELECLPCQVTPLMTDPVKDRDVVDSMKKRRHQSFIAAHLSRPTAESDHLSSRVRSPSKLFRPEETICASFEHPTTLNTFHDAPVAGAVEALGLHDMIESIEFQPETEVENTSFDDAINEVVNFTLQETTVRPGHKPSVNSPDGDKLNFDIRSYLHSTSQDA